MVATRSKKNTTLIVVKMEVPHSGEALFLWAKKAKDRGEQKMRSTNKVRPRDDVSSVPPYFDNDQVEHAHSEPETIIHCPWRSLSTLR